MFRKLSFLAATLTLLLAGSTASAQDEDRDARVRRAEQLIEEEPTLSEVRRAALHHFRVTHRAIGQARDRATSRAGLPYVIMSSRYDGTSADRQLQYEPNPVLLPDLTGDDFTGTNSTSHLTLAWNLPDAVFTPTELQTYPLMLMQQNILRAINRIYYMRRQLYLRLLVDPPRDGRARLALEMRVQSFTALLNAYTGGWFGRNLPEESL